MQQAINAEPGREPSRHNIRPRTRTRLLGTLYRSKPWLNNKMHDQLVPHSHPPAA